MSNKKIYNLLNVIIAGLSSTHLLKQIRQPARNHNDPFWIMTRHYSKWSALARNDRNDDN